MQTIKDIFNTYAPQYLAKFQDRLPAEHRKVITAIRACRTAVYGLTVYQCTDCGKNHHIFRSCGNRHCPSCQQHKAREWKHRLTKNSLPGQYFMITFTVPEEIRRFIRRHQRLAYNGLFKASSSAMKTLAADAKYIGGDLPGFFGVLHTWGRQLQFHPHIHISTSWCPAVHGQHSTTRGGLAARVFICRLKRCQKSTAPSSGTSWCKRT